MLIDTRMPWYYRRDTEEAKESDRKSGVFQQGEVKRVLQEKDSGFKRDGEENVEDAVQLMKR